VLYQIGLTHDELAGSHYAQGLDGANLEARFPYTGVAKVNFARATGIMNALAIAIRSGPVSACHDLSEGGLAVAIAEMALAGLLGLEIDLARVPCDIQTTN